MIAAETITDECFLVRNALDLQEQVELSAYIASRDNTTASNGTAMMPAPRTLILGEDGVTPTVTYRRGDASIVTTLVDKIIAFLKNVGLGEMSIANDIATYASVSMATIRYHAPDGRFPPHIDHCKGSAVCLFSLGRSANFMVRGNADEQARRFQMHSGDVLVFNASSEAKILHGVEGIDLGASDIGEELSKIDRVFQMHRYGVQCRLRF
jgi:hypothetical protein